MSGKRVLVSYFFGDDMIPLGEACARAFEGFGYEVHAVFFDVPLETCLERNRRRERQVPEDVMKQMAQKLKPPTFKEGFSKIIVVRVKSGAAGSHEDDGA